MVKDKNNRKNYTKPSIEYIDAKKMEEILYDWGIDIRATTEVDKVVSEAIATRNKAEIKPNEKLDDRDDR